MREQRESARIVARLFDQLAPRGGNEFFGPRAIAGQSSRQVDYGSPDGRSKLLSEDQLGVTGDSDNRHDTCRSHSFDEFPAVRTNQTQKTPRAKNDRFCVTAFLRHAPTDHLVKIVREVPDQSPERNDLK
jgi:hypothetical protein